MVIFGKIHSACECAKGARIEEARKICAPPDGFANRAVKEGGLALKRTLICVICEICGEIRNEGSGRGMGVERDRRGRGGGR